MSDNKYFVVKYLRANAKGVVYPVSVTDSSFYNSSRPGLIASSAGFRHLSAKLSERIIARLFEAETKEGNAHLRDDYRIAAKAVYNCSKNYPHAWNLAFCEYLGKHPSKLIPYLSAQADRYRAEAEKNLRELALVTASENVLPPKKPVQSETPQRKDKAA